ncbi:helix-turn-helix transcriptional regulator [Demequina iriomotensis]|uniref:helix-turn-helix transcriptional regulator n=1 Tax=Demequina iriomotensis TaxID=1536641 RepID=UPI0007841A63|nr:LuxR family transcriptional regulator [Demequina iriomotensis]
MGDIDTHPEVLGRADELESLHTLIASARNGHGGAIALVGDPGIGKTTLLETVLHGAGSVRILAVTGFAVESELAYSGLQRLGRDLAPYIEQIMPAQRDALRIALGEAAGAPPERALVGLGVLAALARSGDELPTVCVVDDAHLLDRETVEVLGFVARRLAAEAVGLVLAARDDEETMRALAGVPRLELGGLAGHAAAALLRGTVEGELEPGVVAEVVERTGGNPLALAELGARWSAEELTAATHDAAPVPLGPRLEAHYTAVAAGLPADGRRWLMVAAAESTGDIAMVRAAAASLALPPDASTPAEHARLVEVRGAIRFRHPLVRSAMYGLASDAERREVHAALRDAARERGLAAVAAQHAAAAVAGPDEDVAAVLERVADATGARGGLTSRAHLLARAAELSPDPAAGARRLVAAAEAAIGAGAGLLARQLIGTVDPGVLDAETRGRLRMVEAFCTVYLADVSRMGEVVATFVAAADEFHGVAPAREQAALLEALNSALSTEEGARGWPLARLAARMREAADAVPGHRATALRAAAAFALDDYATAATALRECVSMLEALPDEEIADFAFFVVVPTVGLFDFEAAVALLLRVARVCRDRGALRVLDAVLWVLSAVELTRTHPKRAAAYIDESLELRRSLGYADEQTVNAALLVWQGLPAGAAGQLAHGMREAGFGGVARMAEAAIAIQEIAAGEYALAYDRLRPLTGAPYLQSSHHQLPELVEAAVRSGNTTAARETVDRLSAAAAAADGAWLRAMVLRGEALLADADRAEGLHQESLALLGAEGDVGDRARGQLLYGEWLRRSRRRNDARLALRAAHAGFVEVGATAFADRARRELAAIGDRSAGVPDAGPEQLLSAQELQVSRLAARGATNAEIGAALFISANTVDYHLRKVFRKLGVTSRRQLADRFGGA